MQPPHLLSPRIASHRSLPRHRTLPLEASSASLVRLTHLLGTTILTGQRPFAYHTHMMRTITRKRRQFRLFATKLREVRAARKMTQRQLADHLKVGQQAVSSWERATSRPEVDVVASIAELFPEHDFAAWRDASGYGKPSPKASKITAKTPPVRPLLRTLPLEQLGFEQFQGFCALLLELMYGGQAAVNQFGVQGDSQKGIDIEVQFRDGRYNVYQCKRQKKFGPKKIADAIERMTIQCDRAVILLSRPATAAARKAIARRRHWELWDTEDIGQKIHAFPLAKQKRLIDAYFRGYRRDFLGLEDPGALVPAEEYFAPFLRTDQVFSHAWTLVGRESEVATLLKLVERPPHRLTLLVGAGGVGKSRIVLALTEAYRRAHPDHQILVLTGEATPTPSDLEILIDGRFFVIVEDAHEQARIGPVLSALAAHNVQLLVTTRPYAVPVIRSEAQHAGLDVSEESGTITLQPLTLEQAEEVAKEILARCGVLLHLAREIAALTRGSSLALVVGSYLVGTKQIHPHRLNNETEFRDELYSEFRKTVTRGVGVGADVERARALLDLISLLQPIDPDAPDFEQLTRDFLTLRPDHVRRVVDHLRKAGVLTSRRGLVRIVPDLFGEFVLESVSTIASGSSGYLEQVMSLCNHKQLANALRNVSRVDWRLGSADGRPPQIGDAAWQEVERLYNDVPSIRSALFDAAADAAYFQPDRALRFYDIARGTGTADRAATTLLKRAAMTFEYLHPAVQRLWDLAKDDSRPQNQCPDHPLRILKELAAVEPNKPLEFCDAVVEFAIDLLVRKSDRSPQAFEILEAALATEGFTTESRGHSIVMSPFGVKPSAVCKLRQRIVDTLFDQLRDRDIASSCAAARTLGAAISYPHGHLGRVASDDDRAAWGTEFIATLRRLREVVPDPILDPLVLIDILQAVHWHAYYTTGSTRDDARAVIASVPQTLAYRITLALADGWGHLTGDRRDDVKRAMTEWHDEQKRVALELLSTYPRASDAIEVLRERLQTLRHSRYANASPQVFINLLVETHPDVANALCEAVVHQPTDPLQEVFPQALGHLWRTERDKAITITRAAMAHQDIGLTRLVAWSFESRLRSKEPLASDEQAILKRLLQIPDSATAKCVVGGLVARAAMDPSSALPALLEAPIDIFPDVADEACSVFYRSASEDPIGSFDQAFVISLLKRLQNCPSIAGHWVQQFLGHASRFIPAAVLNLLLARVERSEQPAEIRSDPMPFEWDERSALRFRENSEFPLFLTQVREWLLAKPEHRSFWGTRLYAAVAITFDEAVLADLTPWVESGDQAKLSVVASVLRQAPNNFVFQYRDVVVQLLGRAKALGGEIYRDVSSSLWASAVSGFRHGTPGEPFPEDENRRRQAEEALAQISPNSPAWEFFTDLKRGAERDIQRSLKEDEGLLVDS